MRFAHHILIWPLIALGVLASVALLKQARAQYAAILVDVGGIGQPEYVRAFVPFVVRDRYATQICVSTHAGRPYPPFVAPVASWSGSSYAPVQAGAPFMVRDSNGTQICVSTRSGQALPPFILP